MAEFWAASLDMSDHIIYTVQGYKTNCKQAVGYLYILSEGPKDLFGDPESPQETVSPEEVDGLLVRVVPVKVRDGLLEPQEVVHGAGDDVDCCCVPSLCPQVILELCDQW